MDLETAIKNKTSMEDMYLKNRPNLSKNSIKTYVSMLTTMYRKIINDTTGMIPHYTWFIDNIQKILEHLENYHPSKRKTLLSAIVAMGILDDDYTKQIKSQMASDLSIVKEAYQSQSKTNNQQNNWISQDEVKKKFLELEERSKYYFAKSKKQELNAQEKNELQKYIILSLFVLIRPRRVLDYVAFKIRNIDPNKDNYKAGSNFIFNTYKTAKTYGRQTIVIPNKLNSIFSRWFKINDTDFLVWNWLKNEPMTTSKFVYTMNNIFDNKKISVNILRHSYLTDKLSAIPSIHELNNLAREMGHSRDTQIEYIKKD
jgi:hypothetical protein